MSNSEANLLDALEGLLAERRRYEGWIAQLESKREVSPAHVVDRVRADYQSRLDGVTDVLRGRASDLEASAHELQSRIVTIEAEERQRRDERAETELRALVGEYAEDQARQSIAHCDDALGLLAAERERLSAELGRVTEILALVRPAPAPQPVAEPAPAPAPEPVAELETSGPEWAEDSERVIEQAMAVSAPEAFVEPAPETRAPAQGEPAVADSAPADALSPLADELAFLQSVVDTRESPPLVDPLRSEGGDLLPPPVLSAPKRQPTPPSAPAAPQQPQQGFANASNRGPQLTPGSIPSFFKDMPTEQVKTLRCAECGTMNYPTEWYCERCGGELAAM